MSVRTACPFCNAAIVEAAIPATPRYTCPRCGESFTPGPWEASTESVAPAAAQDAKALPKNLFVIASLLAFFAVVAALAYYRPWVPKPIPAVPENTIATVQPPAALSGLQFIPASANIVFALQPAAYAANPQATPLNKLDIPGDLFASLEKAGIAIGDIEQIVGGLTFAPDKPIPGLTLVLTLRHPPLEPRVFLRGLQAERKPFAGRQVFTTKLAKLLMTPTDGKTWIFGFTDEDLATAGNPASGITHFSAAIQASIKERLSPASYAWIVTDNRDWSAASPLLKMAENGEKLAAKLARGRSFAAGLSFEPEPAMRLTVDLADAATAKEVASVVKEKLPADAKVAVEDSRVRVEANANLEKAAEILRSLFNDLKK